MVFGVTTQISRKELIKSYIYEKQRDLFVYFINHCFYDCFMHSIG